MNKSPLTIKELLEHPSMERFMPQENKDKVIDYLIKTKSEETKKDSVYVKILLGTGAWITAALLLVMFGLLNFNHSLFTVFVGICFIITAILLSRFFTSIFTSQLALALALAGNVLVLSLPKIFTGSETGNCIIAHALVCAIVYPLFKNIIYRFLAPLALSFMALAWINEYHFFFMINILIPAEIILFGILLLWKKIPEILIPLRYSACFMLLLTLAWLNISQLTPFRNDFNESLWHSGLFIAVFLIYFYFCLYRDAGYPVKIKPWFILASVCTLLLGLFANPGILFALGLLFTGYVFSDRILTAAAYFFLPCFLFFFYYTMNVDLNYKAWIIGGSGMLLLMVFWIIKLYKPREVSE